jgi:phosphate transport system substrate-binding protein
MLVLIISSIPLSLAREGWVSVSGSTTVMPLAEMCAEEFNFAQDRYRVSVSSGGTGVGITDIAEGRSEIGMASREIKIQERQRYESKGRRFQEHLIGYDAICVVVSPQIRDSGVLGLTREQLRGIYQGSITNWREVGGPEREILVIGRMAGSGTRDTFQEVIMGSREAEAPGVSMEAFESSEVTAAIRGSRQAIGYLGYKFASGDLGALALDGAEPTVENVKKGSYPLARKLYMYTFGEPGPGARAYLAFVLSPAGQRIAMENGFIPL